MSLELPYPAIHPMKPFKKLPHFYFIASALSILTINVPIASANTTIVRTNNPSFNSSSSGMVGPRSYTYGGAGSTYYPYRWVNPNIVPYRLSPTPEGSPYFSYPRTNSPSYFPTTKFRQPQKTMGLTYTSEGGIDHFSMYMEWGNAAIQQKQPQVAMNWYQKALAIRPNDKNAIRAIQSLQTSTRK
jgi:hypothetical protein